jgi:hypothetical protein
VTAPDPPTLRALGRRYGLEWSEAELEALRPGLERAAEALAALERIDLGPTDPAVSYRVDE